MPNPANIWGLAMAWKKTPGKCPTTESLKTRCGLHVSQCSNVPFEHSEPWVMRQIYINLPSIVLSQFNFLKPTANNSETAAGACSWCTCPNWYVRFSVCLTLFFEKESISDAKRTFLNHRLETMGSTGDVLVEPWWLVSFIPATRHLFSELRWHYVFGSFCSPRSAPASFCFSCRYLHLFHP